jgi:hypothetical protein
MKKNEKKEKNKRNNRNYKLKNITLSKYVKVYTFW